MFRYPWANERASFTGLSVYMGIYAHVCPFLESNKRKKKSEKNIRIILGSSAGAASL